MTGTKSVVQSHFRIMKLRFC